MKDGPQSIDLFQELETFVWVQVVILDFVSLD